jgi:predicted AAA+ superfamily ATPase
LRIKIHLEKQIQQNLNQGKAIIILGARQVGKTTLLDILFKANNKCILLNGDELDIQKLFADISADRLKSIFGEKKIVIIDEAQRINDIGLRLKLITDQIKDVQLIATGSSSLELANKINEPLTGRKWEYKMFPFSFGEMVEYHGLLKEKRLLPQRLIYGYYPEVITNEGKEKKVLKEITDSYLYKDILVWENIKKPDKIILLLQALALQIGSQVSYNELGNICGIDSKTVEKYINLLEQTFIIFRLNSYSRNIRNELKNSRKIYFYDNGIRNALIANFSHIELRQDVGALWENFVISERLKFNSYNELWTNTYFWRTKEQKEIDYIEDSDGILSAFEIKWSPNAKYKRPKQFLETYENSIFKVIHKDNIEEFLAK